MLLEGLNLPTDLERRNLKTWYVTSLADEKVRLLEYPGKHFSGSHY